MWRVGRPVLKRMSLAALRGYKRYLSPMLPPSCRFTPSCSVYTMQAVEKYGAVKGCAMGAMRLLRCHPFARGGFDPVR